MFLLVEWMTDRLIRRGMSSRFLESGASSALGHAAPRTPGHAPCLADSRCSLDPSCRDGPRRLQCVSSSGEQLADSHGLPRSGSPRFLSSGCHCADDTKRLPSFSPHPPTSLSLGAPPDEPRAPGGPSPRNPGFQQHPLLTFSSPCRPAYKSSCLTPHSGSSTSDFRDPPPLCLPAASSLNAQGCLPWGPPGVTVRSPARTHLPLLPL